MDFMVVRLAMASELGHMARMRRPTALPGAQSAEKRHGDATPDPGTKESLTFDPAPEI